MTLMCEELLLYETSSEQPSANDDVQKKGKFVEEMIRDYMTATDVLKRTTNYENDTLQDHSVAFQERFKSIFRKQLKTMKNIVSKIKGGREEILDFLAKEYETATAANETKKKEDEEEEEGTTADTLPATSSPSTNSNDDAVASPAPASPLTPGEKA